MTDAFKAWAPWHPTKGFDNHQYEGAFAYADLCRALTHDVADLNDLDGTNARTGWRAVPVNVVPEANAQAMLTALERIRLWLAVEGCDEQREIADAALLKCGIASVACTACSGQGEWDEGPLPARSSAQIDLEYRHVVCAECNGLGSVPLVRAPVKTEIA